MVVSALLKLFSDVFFLVMAHLAGCLLGRMNVLFVQSRTSACYVKGNDLVDHSGKNLDKS